MEGLGRVFNVVAEATGIHIPLTRAAAITFVGFEADGSTIATLKESIAGASEQALVAITQWYKCPGIGGTWTKVTQAAAATIDVSDDVTNDMWCFTVSGSALSDGFNSLEVSVDGGTCFAILHDLTQQRAPDKLASSV